MRSSFAFITSVLFAFGAGEAQAWEFEDVKELHRTLEDEAPSLVARESTTPPDCSIISLTRTCDHSRSCKSFVFWVSCTMAKQSGC